MASSTTPWARAGTRPLPPGTVPTMYDLPSEDPQEPGLPDEFHALQPQLLSQSLRLDDYASDRIFTGSDINLYYDSNHPRWHKRPDWFLVVDVPRLYGGQDLRNSFVVWDEGKAPNVIVELLSPGREQEDLGNYADRLTSLSKGRPLPPYTLEEDETGIAPPPKWEVYEQMLRVPHYVVYSRYTNQLWYFWRGPEGYQEVSLDGANPRAWLADLKIGLGVWHGEFAGITRHWLRWYDAAGSWLPTGAEAAEERLLRAAKKLLATGMDPQQVADMLELPESQVMDR
jgi:Uma2 family endonuclease